MYKILFIEDNKEYREHLTNILREVGYVVDDVSDPIEGLEYFSRNKYDLIISDLMMDTMDGIRFLSMIKNLNNDVKTIILTANPTEDTELTAIDMYVDKYLVKETSASIILKYIERTLNDTTSSIPLSDKILESTAEKIKIYLGQREVYKDNKKIDITAKEYDILVLFLKNKGIALSRAYIIDKLWSKDVEWVDERAIDVHIKKIRAKLQLFSIVSVRGYGYKWNE